jgi:hypothetical protein
MGKAIANTRTIRNHKSATVIVGLPGLVDKDIIRALRRREYAKISNRINANVSMTISVLRSSNKSPEYSARTVKIESIISIQNDTRRRLYNNR